MTEESLLAGIEPEKEEQPIEEVSTQEEETVKTESEKTERPEGLDDAFWDADNNKIKIEELHNAYKKAEEKSLGLRRKLSEKCSDKPPKDVNEYVLNESLNELLPADSETTTLLKEKALEAGLSKDKFNDFMSKVMPALQEKGILQQELTEEEQKVQYEEFKRNELEKLGKDGPKILQTLVNWGEGLVNNGVLSKDELPIYNNMVNSAESMLVLTKLMNLTG